MTEEEKKEFEEFLQWKAEKARVAKETEQLKKEEDSVDPPVEAESNSDTEKTVENPSKQEEVKKDSINALPFVVGVFLLILILFAVGKCANAPKEVMPPEDDYVEVDSIAVVDDVIPETMEPDKKEWDFNIQKDQMTDSKNIWANLTSDNFISQDFPYEGYTYAKITVRYMKKYGYDVLISINKGQIHGSRYNGDNYITVRFDEGTAKRFYFNEAADGSSDVVFLNAHSDFIKRCKQAKDIKIEVPIYQAGRPVFTFHVDEPLTWREE